MEFNQHSINEAKFQGQEDRSTRVGVVQVNTRIPELEEFYVSGSVQLTLAPEVDIKGKHMTSAETKGQWAIEQAVSYAKALGVYDFIMPEDEGGRDIPTLASEEEYIESHCLSISEQIEETERVVHSTTQQRARLMNRIEGVEETIARMSSDKEDDDGGKGKKRAKGGDDHDVNLEAMRDKLDDLIHKGNQAAQTVAMEK